MLNSFVASQQHLGFEDGAFETCRGSNPIFCHQEFLEKIAERDRDSIARRAAFLLQRLTVGSRRLHYKSTRGLNQGWRRSRLGGNRGSHFYAWWAPKNALPLKESGGFGETPDGAIFLRAIRHHDDHSELSAHSVASHYLPVTVQDLRREEYAPSPWTQQQVRFAAARAPVRLLKGHPGSGKTTALWHAADTAGKERILYVTYSPDLAALAREYFDRFCSSHKQFEVMTFPNLVRHILGEDAFLSGIRIPPAIFARLGAIFEDAWRVVRCSDRAVRRASRPSGRRCDSRGHRTVCGLCESQGAG